MRSVQAAFAPLREDSAQRLAHANSWSEAGRPSEWFRCPPEQAVAAALAAARATFAYALRHRSHPVDDRELPCGTCTTAGRARTRCDATPEAAHAEIARLSGLSAAILLGGQRRDGVCCPRRGCGGEAGQRSRRARRGRPLNGSGRALEGVVTATATPRPALKRGQPTAASQLEHMRPRSNPPCVSPPLARSLLLPRPISAASVRLGRGLWRSVKHRSLLRCSCVERQSSRFTPQSRRRRGASSDPAHRAAQLPTRCSDGGISQYCCGYNTSAACQMLWRGFWTTAKRAVTARDADAERESAFDDESAAPKRESAARKNFDLGEPDFVTPRVRRRSVADAIEAWQMRSKPGCSALVTCQKDFGSAQRLRPRWQGERFLRMAPAELRLQLGPAQPLPLRRRPSAILTTLSTNLRASWRS
jgi:hypothetical protein